jgi:hypothetical protein
MQDGARPRIECANTVRRVHPIEQNDQRYPIVPASIFRQQLSRRGVRQEDIT